MSIVCGGLADSGIDWKGLRLKLEMRAALFTFGGCQGKDEQG